MNRLLNDTFPSTRRNRNKTKFKDRHTKALGRYITIGLGVGIPLLSLSLSHLGGSLLIVGHWVLGLFAMGLCLSVLTVSLGHLAWAIGDITKSEQWANWAMAITVDLSLVCTELVGVYAPDAGWMLRVLLMGSVTVASMVLNVWAFRRHMPRG